MSPGIAISMTQPLSFLFTATIFDFIALITVTLDHNILQNPQFFIFNSTFWMMFIPFFASFQVVFLTQFPMNNSCNIIMPSLVLLLCQHEIFFHFPCHVFCKVVIGLFYLSCVSHSLFELSVLVRFAKWLPFQLSSQLFSASSMFLFQSCFWHFSYILFIHFILP